MRFVEIEIDGKKLPIHFSANAVEEIQERYGALEKLAEEIAKAKELKWIMCLIINSAYEYKNYFSGEQNKMISEKEMGMMLSAKDLRSPAIGEAILKSFNESVNIEKN